jgi:uncharacterized protein (AIM24 family)
MPVHDQLLGSTQPVLSISLEPGESIVAATGEFAWMTDSIQMTAGRGGLSAYQAKDFAGTIAFASRLPGSIITIDITTDREFLVHRHGFLAGTPGVEVSTGFQQTLGASDTSAGDFILRRVSGTGRAWVELSGDVVRRDLTAGTSLRTHPWHIGICDASVAVQTAELTEAAGGQFGDDARYFAVLSGPGSVWLQSMPLLAAPRTRLTSRTDRVPAAEGAAGPRSEPPGRPAT